MGINTVPQPPYSTDLASCDFCLFPKLRGCRYEIIEMKEAVTKVIDTLTQEDIYEVFQKLLERYIKCITAGGDYLFNDPRIYICIYICVCVCVYVCVCVSAEKFISSP